MSPGVMMPVWRWGAACTLFLGLVTGSALQPASAQTAPAVVKDVSESLPNSPKSKSPTGPRSHVRSGAVKQVQSIRDPNTVGIVAGEAEGGALLFANEMARVIAAGQETGPNGELALRILPIAGRGGLHNIRDLLSLPGVDMAIAQEHILARLRESKELGDISNKLVYVTKLFNEELHLVARGDIRQISDLKGKPVNFGDHGSSTEDVASDLFKTLNIDVNKVFLGQGEALAQMRQGKIAATLLLAPKPAASMVNLTRDSGFHLLSVPFPMDAAGYLPTSLRHSDYPNLIPTGEAVETVAVGTVLLAFNWPEKNARYRLLQSFAETFFSRFPELQTASPNPKWQEINLAAVLPEWKRFGPAEQWLQTNQAWLRNQREQTARGGSVPGLARESPDTTGSIPPESGDAKLRNLFEEFLEWRERQGKR